MACNILTCSTERTRSAGLHNMFAQVRKYDHPLFNPFSGEKGCLFLSFVRFCQSLSAGSPSKLLINCLYILVDMTIDHCSIEDFSLFFIIFLCGCCAKSLDHSLILSHRHVSVCMRDSCFCLCSFLARASRALVVTLGHWQENLSMGHQTALICSV